MKYSTPPFKHLLTFAAASICFSATLHAQTPPPKTAPPPTTTAPKSSNPEDAHTATTSGAAKSTFQAGKKPDASAGCSTPTDARSAGVDTSKDSAGKKRSDNTRTVCTTAGAEGVGASEK